MTARTHQPSQSIDFNSICNSASPYKHTPRVSQISYQSSLDLKRIYPIPISNSVKSGRQSSASAYQKEETQKLFDRLYSEAASKKLTLEQTRAQEKDKDLEECTFRPEISDSYAKSQVYDRLSFDDIREKDELRKQQKIKYELQGCTFRPKTNSVCALRTDSSYDKLYSDAENFRQKMRDIELGVKDKDLEECTFRPQVLKPCKTSSGKIYEKLYKNYQDSQRDKRKKEIERRLKETEETNFIPKLITPRKIVKGDDNKNVYARLYAEVQNRKEKEKKREESTKRSTTPKKIIKSDAPPRFEVLYSLSKTASQRKMELEAKLVKEAGITFKPDLSKTNSPVRARTELNKVRN